MEAKQPLVPSHTRPCRPLELEEARIAAVDQSADPAIVAPPSLSNRTERNPSFYAMNLTRTKRADVPGNDSLSTPRELGVD